ncbi:MAG TPA: mechanosensitive ion channel [Saprospiraceae bacterium]|nr:mechanosensitive ion channel [Saprospiraceae bacterium]MCB9328953.1 mechanosensitive ion channel [Lewinellaceae bacterium]HPK10333.1 mechanosensitive ion channel [Saprospiraceae bacterium]HPQ20649.1 mechanosensitive ion channel [Saprospiraceae bacterium]HRX28746.1 mechanosensitive ion channel [Saprospiraceae bacterium]
MENLPFDFKGLLDAFMLWVPKLVGAILILIIGFWLANLISKIVGKRLDKMGLDKDIQPFLKSLVSVLLKVLVVLTAAGVVGVEITAFAALLAGAGLAIGAAMSGTLGHFASGVMILIFKPYRVGDLIDVQGQLGHVDEIQVFNTIITTLDNKKVIIPNGVATSGIITNLSEKGKLRVDLNVAMPYEEDFAKIQQIIKGALQETPKVLSDEPTIEIEKFDANNILLAVRPFATPEDYWDVYFGAYKNIKKALGANGIPVAYPRTKVDLNK